MESTELEGNRSIKRLYRSKRDKKIAGICGGLGMYLGIDPVIVRIALLASAFAGGFGILAYLIGWFIIPVET